MFLSRSHVIQVSSSSVDDSINVVKVSFKSLPIVQFDKNKNISIMGNDHIRYRNWAIGLYKIYFNCVLYSFSTNNVQTFFLHH